MQAGQTQQVPHLALEAQLTSFYPFQTVAAITTLFLAMLYNPSTQAEAQAEIERVIGTERLPTYADRESLPYVEAIYKEVLRWRPVTPFAIPHKYSSKNDDEYLGTFTLFRYMRMGLMVLGSRNANPSRSDDPPKYMEYAARS